MAFPARVLVSLSGRCQDIGLTPNPSPIERGGRYTRSDEMRVNVFRDIVLVGLSASKKK